MMQLWPGFRVSLSSVLAPTHWFTHTLVFRHCIQGRDLYKGTGIVRVHSWAEAGVARWCSTFGGVQCPYWQDNNCRMCPVWNSPSPYLVTDVAFAGGDVSVSSLLCALVSGGKLAGESVHAPTDARCCSRAYLALSNAPVLSTYRPIAGH